MQAQYDYRLVIVDISLQGSQMNGWELSKRLRAEAPRIQICIYTGSNEILFEFQSGMPVIFLLKSTRLEALLEVIEGISP